MENLKEVQLLVLPFRRKFMLISQILRQLESNVDTELWGGLLSPEDKIMSAQTHNILGAIELLRKESKTFNALRVQAR